MCSLKAAGKQNEELNEAWIPSKICTEDVLQVIDFKPPLLVWVQPLFGGLFVCLF